MRRPAAEMQHAPFTHTHSDEDEILSIFMWLKVSPSERSTAERWGADGGETERGRAEERKGKREEDSVCFSVSTHRYFLRSTLSLFISHRGVRGVGGRACLERPHTRLAFRKLALAGPVGIMNGEVTHTAVVYNNPLCEVM